MSLHAAQHHERHSIDHAHNVIESEIWWNPPAPDAAAWIAPMVEDPHLTLEEIKIRESRAHVDHVWDMVPFWIRGIEAAERGEMLKLEQFLETLRIASDTWSNARSDNLWTNVDPIRGWGDAWEMEEQNSKNQMYDWKFGFKVHAWSTNNKTLSSADTNGPNIPRTQQRQQSRIKNGLNLRENHPGDTYEFVEEVARRQAAGDERKQQMHIFFNVCEDRPFEISD
ncbi:hypothetical protein BDZ94DRAFT_1228080 [Collybia nuda]|uniref:Uncharacterized protein n=1 Tax=Collybia nuda TaxID=64659 RepID=A0A9P6CCP8_9AGAR|nr:hypothetical protein BDZ94DRAFT_1228080 [Collybia nuda]